MELSDLYLKDKLCKIRGLTKSTSLNGQCAKVVEWVEKTGRITVKLKNDREIALKLSNITMEDLEPVICSFKIRDKMENYLEQSIQLAVAKTKLANMEDIRKFFFMITNIESQSIITNNYNTIIIATKRPYCACQRHPFMQLKLSVHHVSWMSCVSQFVGNRLVKQRQSDRQRC